MIVLLHGMACVEDVCYKGSLKLYRPMVDHRLKKSLRRLA